MWSCGDRTAGCEAVTLVPHPLLVRRRDTEAAGRRSHLQAEAPFVNSHYQVVGPPRLPHSSSLFHASGGLIRKANTESAASYFMTTVADALEGEGAEDLGLLPWALRGAAGQSLNNK
ncbi:hypothetical protein VZT92_008347 [Zoarces viviparus]|uniref:Uncharacterized protein n=1 Tax=Zoarces viviparus TaxID=48416 RepID=A0AAW1FEX3_ZOAVI